jgi:hypothetical protein
MSTGEGGRGYSTPPRVSGSISAMSDDSIEEVAPTGSPRSVEGFTAASNLILPERGDEPQPAVVAHIRGYIRILRDRLSIITQRISGVEFLSTEWEQLTDQIAIIADTLEALRRELRDH